MRLAVIPLLAALGGCAAVSALNGAAPQTRHGVFAAPPAELVACVGVQFSSDHRQDSFVLSTVAGAGESGATPGALSHLSMLVGPNHEAKPTFWSLDARAVGNKHAEVDLVTFPGTMPPRYTAEAIWRVLKECERIYAGPMV
jgi:hypothetical protein